MQQTKEQEKSDKTKKFGCHFFFIFPLINKNPIKFFGVAEKTAQRDMTSNKANCSDSQ